MVKALIRWLGIVVALAIGAPAAASSATCAGLGVAADYDAFALGGYRVQNTQVQGRVAAGGDVAVSSYGVGTALGRDPARVDLIAGGALTASNAQAANGSVTYATTLSGTIATPNGTLTSAPPPFSFATAFAALELLSAQLADLPANGTIAGPTYGALQLTGTSATRNVFAISAARLQTAQQIQIRVPFGSTTVVDVSGTTYTTAALPTTSIAFWDGSAYRQFSDTAPTPQLDALRRALVWNFPLANRIQIGPNLAWQGTVLAPDPALAFPGSTQLNGQIVAASIEGNGTVIRRPFAGCLPPPPTHDLELTALCRNALSDATKLRLRNSGDEDVTVTWTDRDSAQQGTFLARAGRDTFFAVQDGRSPHRITVASATESVHADAVPRACAGTVVVRKAVTGDGAPPAGPWRVTIAGDSGFVDATSLAAGAVATFSVPGDYQVGSAPIGTVVGGFNYTVEEPDPRGAVATISQDPVTILDGQAETVVIGNDYPATPGEPGGGGTTTTTPSLPSPGATVVQPSQPTLVPGAPTPPPGPNLVAAQSTQAPDLTVDERVTPSRTVTGAVARSVIVVRNRGAAPAADVVVRELPQHDPDHPNRVVRIVDVRGAADCTSIRPVRCALGTLAPGQAVTIRGEARVLIPGALKSVVVVSSPTPESNTTNNIGTDGIVVRTPVSPLRVVVRSPAAARVGQTVRYRVSVTAPGRGVSAVRLCHRPAPGLLVLSARGTERVDGRRCLDIRRLGTGRTRSFTVRALASGAAAGDNVVLTAAADSPGRARPARGADRTRVIAAEPSGLG
jgi:choice-of-anchor A domain-containing protein